MVFDPKKHVIRIQGGREYLPVAARLVWFRGEHPDWGIVTSPVEINMEKQYAIFSCQIFNADGKLMATATKMENVRGFGDFLEKAETGSVGRALAYCGYGTQFAPELEEESRYADAPYPASGSPAQAANVANWAANGVTATADAPPRYDGASVRPGGGVQRVREQERNLADPGGSDDDEADPFLDDEDGGIGEGSIAREAVPPVKQKPNNVLAGNQCSVDGCKSVLTAGQMTMSMNKFGKALCLLHQREANPAASTESASRRNGAGARASSEATPS